MLDGVGRLSQLPTLFFNKRALSPPAGSWPHDAEQDKGSIYALKELETKKRPEAAKALSPHLKHFGFWWNGVIRCGHKGVGLSTACFKQEVLWGSMEVGRGLGPCCFHPLHLL